MPRVLLTGAAGSLGRRVLALLAGDDDVDEIVALDLVEPPTLPPRCRFIAADLATADLKPLVEGADEVVHLAFEVEEPGGDLDPAARLNAEATRRLLDAAGAVGVEHVVLVSSAAAYGAWPSNPVPITEEAPLRPNPGAGYAQMKAEIERLGSELAAGHPGISVTVLRPAIAVAPGEPSWLARAIGLVAGVRAGDGDQPVQVVHLDDLASAVALARRRRLDGPYNVAADGWLTAEQARALAGSPPRLRLPEPVARRLAAASWRWRVGRTPPGLVPYTAHPWVVANDRLEAEGWAPAHTNEETYVESTSGTPWSRLSPKRRQEVALAGTVVAGAVVVVAAVAAVRRIRARRSGPVTSSSGAPRARSRGRRRRHHA